MRPARHIRKHGFTLIEVLVAIILFALFSPIIATVCRSHGLAIKDVNNRAAIARETGFMTGSLSRDFGRAEGFTVPGDGTLHLQVYASPGDTSQVEVVYFCDSHACLWRQQSGTLSNMVVATGVTMFGVHPVPDLNTVQLDVCMERGENQRQLSFRFQGGTP